MAGPSRRMTARWECDCDCAGGHPRAKLRQTGWNAMNEMQAMEIDASFRRESDSIGDIDVPSSAYYGAQTARAIDNFQISGLSIGQYPELIRALALIKKAAAI